MMFFKKKNNGDENFNISEYNEEEVEVDSKPKFKSKLIINIIFIVIIILGLFIATDIICVNNYNSGPFFAIKTKTYNDGGTKVYYGLGYKVIKYHQTVGRRDMVMGTYSLPYATDPTNVELIDLAIGLRDYPDITYKKYAKQFLRITGKLASIDNKKHTMTLKYTDPDKDYTLEVICSMADNITYDKVASGSITIIGSVNKFSIKTKTSPNRLYISNSFAE